MSRTGGPPRSREGYHWFRGWRKPTRAQRRVLDELVAGGTNAQIAERLGISEDGVKWHLSELRDETGLADRRELARWWEEERERPGVNLLLPFAAIARFVSHNAAATAVVVGVSAVSLLGGWLAFENLRGEEGPSAAAVVSLQTPQRPTAVPFIPTPTPTPGLRGALLFDVTSGEARILPGEYTHRRWLDTEAMTFTVLDGKASMIDAEGNLTPILDRSGVQVLPDTDNGRAIIWDWDGGLLEVVDIETGAVVESGDFGPMPGGRRNWAVSPAAARVALTISPYSSVVLYDFDAANPQVTFTTRPGEAVWRIEWSPGGEWLLVVAVVQAVDNKIESERSLVFRPDGTLVLEQPVSAGWLGARALALYERQSDTSVELSAVLDMAHQGQIPVPEGSLLCISPDGRHAVTADPALTFGRPTEHHVVDLVTRETVASATMSKYLVNCDWTPDGGMVVLSPGGK